jgi:hypothetical protein
VDAWVLVTFGFFVTLVAITFIVLVHLNFREAMHHCMNAYDQSIHAHDDASTRIADHRRLDNERMAMVTRWGETMAKTQSELAQFILADSAAREDEKAGDPNEETHTG